ncbi:MAG: BrnT family toxin [Cypionkella sp.]|uniref:BrnT family toxin n=1 Tax=Cypionkella sp. TaxID=2811411 RepID=UPI002AB95726|nr:BrnT family toxin [Cypionkella sp.]MDZ4312690.1 BrnT family toxin [Cypionkella sp.]
MQIEYDPAKRDATLLHRGLDMADTAEVFLGMLVTVEDLRQDYGETRFTTVSFLQNRMVVVIWTRRGPVRRIISLRKANAREQAQFGPSLRS